jgi:hypothetical protein
MQQGLRVSAAFFAFQESVRRSNVGRICRKVCSSDRLPRKFHEATTTRGEREEKLEILIIMMMKDEGDKNDYGRRINGIYEGRGVQAFDLSRVGKAL